MKLIDILVQELPKRGGWPEGYEVVSTNGYGAVWAYKTKGCTAGRELYFHSTKEGHVTREQYEAALAAKKDGWVEWGGGECPVEKGTLVDVKYLDGGENNHVSAGVPLDRAGSDPNRNAYGWEKNGHPSSIIAYRLHQPQQADKVRAAAWNAYAGIAEVSGDKANLNECIGQDATPAWSGEGLPPVGCFCEVEDLDGMLVYGQGESGEVIAHVENTAVIRMSYGLGCFEARFLRPLRTEADKKRDAAVMAINNTVDASGTLGSEIYNAIATGKIPGVKLED